MFDKLKALLDNQRKILKLYALGALLFFVGLGFIQWADKLMEPSLEQEAHALLGTVIAGVGFFIAMFSQVLMIVSRFHKLGRRDT